jgi:riboflavin kinase/FMN adenylyltransferase
VKVYTNFDELKEIKNPVLTIGTFDGVHIGHQKILEKIQDEAKKINGETVLFTFFPHPRLVINPSDNSLRMIQTLTEKIEVLEKLGLDHLIIFPFTKEFSQLTAEDFIVKYLVEKLKMKVIVVGYDHRFGKGREGDLAYLQKLSGIYNYQVIEIPAQEIEEVNVSSTRIRNAILSGDIETANAYLSSRFQLTGKVVAGKQVGRTIGYPTANIEVEDALKIIPAIGIYVVKVFLADGKMCQGMMSIGKNPTVSETDSLKLEVNIFNFNQDIYNQLITVQFLKYVRNEVKFNSLEELTHQLDEDKKTALDYFSIHN